MAKTMSAMSDWDRWLGWRINWSFGGVHGGICWLGVLTHGVCCFGVVEGWDFLGFPWRRGFLFGGVAAGRRRCVGVVEALRVRASAASKSRAIGLLGESGEDSVGLWGMLLTV